MRSSLAAAVVLALGIGCAGDPDPGPAAPDGGPALDAAPGGRIEIPATNGAMELPFSLNVTGAGESRVGAISVLNAGGRVEVHGVEVDVLVYEHQAWPEYGYDLYQTLAVAPDRIYAIWFYCEGSELAALFLEGTDGTHLAAESVDGTCSASGAPSARAVSLPAVEMPWPAFARGYRIDGDDVSYGGDGPGHAVLAGVEYVLLPFETVNCSGCEPGGWHELHALLWDPGGQRACFGIFYMREGEPDQVELHYTICLPDLSRPGGVFPARWTRE